ncbi:transposase [Kitasatospora sp. GAS204A]|uniref:transposase n=1 Tax=unclassified Kitasatospora TaxID=2633591 RepID=UPI002476BAE0|nr:transposase [Kitasatospora sp. GAS204B]MDH6118555.1 transposase [Kitasatospora sp. GAS204B]
MIDLSSGTLDSGKGHAGTAPWLVDDETWAAIEPLLPSWPGRGPGPRPVDDRRCLQGILFVLCTGIAWQHLPLELGFGSGQTCWRRLYRWTAAGVLPRIHGILLSRPHTARRINWTRTAVAAPGPQPAPDRRPRRS